MKAIGLVRQSKGDEGSTSPEVQRDRIADHCEREGWTLVETHEEVDVSGRRPLSKRPGLKAAVEAVEAGRADVVVLVYGDRLCRDVEVHREVVRRIEQADGTVLSLDRGVITYSTAAGRLMSTFNAGMDEYYAVLSGEKTTAARERAIAEGRPCSRAPFGYVLEPHVGLTVDPEKAEVVREAFRMRLDGAAYETVRRMFRERGYDVSFYQVQRILRNRAYLGEVRHGDFVNPTAHEPIVDADVFRRVESARVPRGGRTKSDALLARLGVLRCGTCGARMVVATATGRDGERIGVYRCPPNNDCPNRQSITARIVEEKVVDAVRRAVKDLSGQASASTREAREALDLAEMRLRNAIDATLGLDPRDVAPRLQALTAERDEARDRLNRLEVGSSFAVLPGVAWEELSLKAQRELIVAVMEAVEVRPGRGPERVVLRPRENFVPPQRTLDREAAQIRDDVEALRAESVGLSAGL